MQTQSYRKKICSLRAKKQTKERLAQPHVCHLQPQKTQNYTSRMLVYIRTRTKQESQEEGPLLAPHICLRADGTVGSFLSHLSRLLVTSMELITSQREAGNDVETIEKLVEGTLKAQGKIPKSDQQKTFLCILQCYTIVSALNTYN